MTSGSTLGLLELDVRDPHQPLPANIEDLRVEDVSISGLPEASVKQTRDLLWLERGHQRARRDAHEERAEGIAAGSHLDT
jgi:hypothetical protein